MDYEYERADTAAVFMFCGSARGWRLATGRKRRTNTGWAHELADLREGRCAGCKRVTLVPDNLNTHEGGALGGVRAGAGESAGASDRLPLPEMLWKTFQVAEGIVVAVKLAAFPHPVHRAIDRARDKTPDPR